MLALGEADEGRGSRSGIGIEVRRLVGVLGEVRVVDDLRRSLEDDLRVDREDRCRFSRGSLSLSPSRGFDEGMVGDGEEGRQSSRSRGRCRRALAGLAAGVLSPAVASQRLALSPSTTLTPLSRSKYLPYTLPWRMAFHSHLHKVDFMPSLCTLVDLDPFSSDH